VLIQGFQIDQDSALPVYRQIADAVRQAAQEGRLEVGHRLPPTRDLARQLGVNRHTVIAAYEALASEGWVQSHTGKGTFLVQPGDTTAAGSGTSGDTDAAGSWLTAFSRAVEGSAVRGLLSVYKTATATEGISFAGSYPASDLLPVESFAGAMAATLRDQGDAVLTYGPTAGHAPLRELIASLMNEAGSRVGPDDILITNGAQQAIELVLYTFLERGDAVVIEEPTYTGRSRPTPGR